MGNSLLYVYRWQKVLENSTVCVWFNHATWYNIISISLITKMVTSLIVIDDDHDTVDVFCEYLTLKGFEVKAKGYNGKDAVELYSRLTPDIVLMDVMMPEYNGFYGLYNIKEKFPESRIIMVTADLSDETQRKLIERGASDILYKPYDIEDVLKSIKRVLGERDKSVIPMNLKRE